MNRPEPDKVSDEMLMCLADGELDGPEAMALRSRIARDPALAARYALFVDSAEALRDAFAQGPVPERLVAAASGQVAGRAGQARVLPFPRRAVQALSLAATLALGLGLGWSLREAPDTAVEPNLTHVALSLANTRTGETFDLGAPGAARVLGSFETDLGLCRLIGLEGRESMQHRFVACRAGDTWEIALSLSDAPGRAFTPATEIGTEIMDIFLDGIGAGAALDPASEQEALRAN